MASISFRGLTKVFERGSAAVQDLDLEVADGEFMVLVGPSGSGKTTVLRIAAGLEQATDGEVWIGERRVDGVAPMDRDIAMVFQSYALYPHMTVYENMAFGLKLHRVRKPEIRERVLSTARMLGIDDLLERKPAQLSGGQRQRVAMGRAIVRDPAAFLMDEPLSNLDAKLRVEMRAYLATLHRQLRTTTLYVTHDQTEAMTMGDRVAVMSEGRLQQVDAPQALYERPANLFVAGFIGSPAMNLVRSRLRAADAGVVVELGPLRLPLPERVLRERPSLGAHVGREVIVGVRPEDIEDAALAPSRNGGTLDVHISLAEALGAELVAHFPVPAAPVLPAALERGESGGEGAGRARELRALAAGEPPGEAIFTARLSPRSGARTGSRARLLVDAGRLHFFDPETHAAIW